MSAARAVRARLAQAQLVERGLLDEGDELMVEVAELLDRLDALPSPLEVAARKIRKDADG